MARKLSIIYLLTLALLFNAVAPVFANSDLSGDGSSNKVLLCTSQGYQWVSLDEQTGTSPTSQKSSIHCVLCVSGDDVADSSQFISLDLRHVFFSVKPLPLTDHYPLLQSLFISRLADSRSPPHATV